MALSIGVDQLAVHRCSEAVVQDQVSGNLWRKKSEWQPPTFTVAVREEDEPVIPSPNVFEDLEGNTTTSGDSSGSGSGSSPEDDHVRLPRVAECAVHLQLLDSLAVLRERVLKSNALDCAFSIKPVEKFKMSGYGRSRRKVKETDRTFKTRREKKWPLLVKLAVVRFVRWCKGLEENSTNIFNEMVDTGYYLPPLDILMVWHSLMLNPRLLKTFCEVEKCPTVLGLNMSWVAIHIGISSKDSSYTHSTTTAPTCYRETRLSCDLIQYLSDFKKFPPEIISVLSKWANTELKLEDVNQALTDATEITSDQVSFLEDFKLIINDKQEDSPSHLLLEQLGDGVLRQFKFVEKMAQHSWLRSPVLGGTLRRARDRYAQYLTLFKRYPSRMFVPTLDIDLVWHTHLCAPGRYGLATAARAGRFIYHDDTIAQERLTDGLEATHGLYRVRYGEEYLRCLCWDCETLREALDEIEDRDGAASEMDYEEVAEAASAAVVYYRAVEIARRKKQPLPARAV